MQEITKRGERIGDRGRLAIRALTYRVIKGPLDRLVFRVGFDYRSSENAETVAKHQRFPFRIPTSRRRLFSSDADRAGEVGLFCDLLRRGGTFKHVTAAELSA